MLFQNNQKNCGNFQRKFFFRIFYFRQFFRKLGKWSPKIYFVFFAENQGDTLDFIKIFKFYYKRGFFTKRITFSPYLSKNEFKKWTINTFIFL